jgi:hypothetical protein
MDDLHLGDVLQQYQNALFQRGDSLVFIDRINTDDNKCRILDLQYGKRLIVPFNPKEYQPPANRIGMVNIARSVVFISRNTVRQFSRGLTSGNCSFSVLPVPYPSSSRAVVAALKELSSAEIWYAYTNQYPSLSDAIIAAREYQGACAFDKQFAVDCNGCVFYKTQLVGNVVDDAVCFQSQFEYLTLLLKGNYVKSLRTSRYSPIKR